MWPFPTKPKAETVSSMDERPDIETMLEDAIADFMGGTSRLDGFVNPTTGLGLQNSKTQCTRWQPETQWDRELLQNIYRFQPIAARLIDRGPDDSLANGFSVPELTPAAQEALDDYNLERSFLTKFNQALKWENLFGGSLLLPAIDDGSETLSEPIRPNNIRAIGPITALSRHDVTVSEFENDPSTGEIQSPAYYELINTNVRIHPSRVIRFGGIPLTAEEMRDNESWGGSKMDRVRKDVMRFVTMLDYLNEAIVRISQGIFQSPELNRAGKSDMKARLMARMAALGQWLGIMGDIAIGTEEDYKVVQRGVQGFKDAYDVFESALVASDDMPRSIMLGETTGFLNSGENAGDWKSWSSSLASDQVTRYNPKVRTWLSWVFASDDFVTSTPDRWTIRWSPIAQPSDEETAENLSKTSSATTGLVASQILTVQEARTNEAIRANYVLDGEGSPE